MLVSKVFGRLCVVEALSCYASDDNRRPLLLQRAAGTALGRGGARVANEFITSISDDETKRFISALAATDEFGRVRVDAPDSSWQQRRLEPRLCGGLCWQQPRIKPFL